MRARLLFVFFLALPPAHSAHAHGGGLNKDGCHNNRKTGGYHCHRGPAASPPHESYRPQLQQYAPQLDVTPDDASGGAFEFRNCSEGRAAGAAPVHRGEPGYGEHLDSDGDGVGCEPYRGRRVAS
jgi:hypothetical protein